MPLEEQLKITASMGLNVLELGITNAPIVSKSYNRKKNNTMNKPKVIFLPHANIQYLQLAPERRQWVMKNCYEKLFDLIDNGDYKIGFEASGITIDEMANQAPEVLAKLKKLVQEGKVEPVCSPYIHFMLANIPKEVCLHSLKYSIYSVHNKNRPIFRTVYYKITYYNTQNTYNLILLIRVASVEPLIAYHQKTA